MKIKNYLYIVFCFLLVSCSELTIKNKGVKLNERIHIIKLIDGNEYIAHECTFWTQIIKFERNDTIYRIPFNSVLSVKSFNKIN